jgi:hypothetical protein
MADRSQHHAGGTEFHQQLDQGDLILRKNRPNTCQTKQAESVSDKGRCAELDLVGSNSVQSLDLGADAENSFDLNAAHATLVHIPGR